MENEIIGFIATSASVIAFGSQFVYTLKTKTTAGISIYRTILDVASLTLWIAYAARLEDLPLLIATSCELTTSIALLFVILHNRKHLFALVKDYTPPPTPPNSEDFTIIEVKPERRNSI
jgi:uncharacterized protein with PQ loop repeat